MHNTNENDGVISHTKTKSTYKMVGIFFLHQSQVLVMLDPTTLNNHFNKLEYQQLQGMLAYALKRRRRRGHSEKEEKVRPNYWAKVRPAITIQNFST